jgi:hypothetical protein
MKKITGANATDTYRQTMSMIGEKWKSKVEAVVFSRRC